MIKDSFSYTLRALLFYDAQYPGHSTQNPGNSFLRLHRHSAELHVRPDFFLDTPLISGFLKPRLISYHRWWEDGLTRGKTKGLTTIFVNEWLAQLKPHSSVFLSYGKEKLLWGPSFLVSPSNLLFKDNEKANPKTEVEGKYLARLTYLPSNALTFTAILETQGEDRETQGTDRPLRALKMDVLGSSFLLCVVGYLQSGDHFRLGSFGQWTASDALLLYYDGIASEGINALYPVEDRNNPLGGKFIRKYDDSGRLVATVTVGGSYTFLSGATLSGEFLYNGAGYNEEESKQYYRLRRNAAAHLPDGNLLAPLSQRTLSEALNTGSPFLRRYYLMAQFAQRDIKNVLDVIVRYTHSLQEHSGRFSTILEWQVSNKIRFFNINTVAVGKRDTEFKSVLSRSVMAGIEVHF